MRVVDSSHKRLSSVNSEEVDDQEDEEEDV